MQKCDFLAKLVLIFIIKLFSLGKGECVFKLIGKFAPELLS